MTPRALTSSRPLRPRRYRSPRSRVPPIPKRRSTALRQLAPRKVFAVKTGQRQPSGRALRQLAAACGIQLSYEDMAGQPHHASPEALAALLELWGFPANNSRAVSESLRARQKHLARRVLPPVLVAWEHRPIEVQLKLGASELAGTQCLLQLENGATQPLALLPGGTVRLPPLPFGYHFLKLELRARRHQTLVISAPSTSYSPPDTTHKWGAFLPMYALHTQRSWGAGNLGDWQQLTRFMGSLGTEIMATLPLNCAFLDTPFCEPSPYSPASRLFWNEFYLDITAIPEFVRCAPARKLVSSVPFQARLAAFRSAALIDYRAQAELRRQVLHLLAQTFFKNSNSRTAQFEQFLKQRPRCNDYAEFRATCDATRAPWPAWPERANRGKLEKGDYALSDKQYYLYTQWVAEEQIRQWAGGCRAGGTRLGLDLPLGVHPNSYDAWRERDLFAATATVGAPPDLFFTKGQNWGFPPLHPERLRQHAYGYWLESLRFQLRHAGLLRIDHIMGLHRLYWIPAGFPADQGAYVAYPAEEFHAMLCLESHRYQTVIQGENLGTVPPEVNHAMARHRFRQTYVLQYQQRANCRQALQPPPASSVASLNTHDLPTFAAHWQGLDLADRKALGLLSEKQLAEERSKRVQLNWALAQFLRKTNAKTLPRGAQLGCPHSVRAGRNVRSNSSRAPLPRPNESLSACLRWLAASEAEFLLVNLEDLWLEARPQNVPGTSDERPNWRRKARFTLEQILQLPEVRELLMSINRLRHQNKGARKQTAAAKSLPVF